MYKVHYFVEDTKDLKIAAHGKRSGSQAALPRVVNEAPSSIDDAKPEWFFSKIISPLDLRYYVEGNELDASKNQAEIDDLFTDMEGENAKRLVL